MPVIIILRPGLGAGSNDGGANTPVGDTVSFEDITTAGAGVTLVLVAGGGTAADQSTTVVSTVENLTGTPNSPDRLTGDDGDNKLNGLGDNDVLTGGDGGNDTITGDTGNDTLIGGIGNDVMTGDAGDDILRPGLGAGSNDGGANTPVGDTVSFEDITTAGAGVTLVLVAGGGTAADQSTTVVSTVENLTGTPNSPDRLTGDDGDNKLNGLGDNDVLTGGDGNDTITGDTGNDTLIGGIGNDVMTGDAGDDILRPGLGAGSNDGGANTPVGDTVSFEDITTAGAGVTLVLVAGGGTAADQSTTVVSTVENLTGTPNSPDRLTGDDGDNKLNGLGDNDVLTGGDGNDTITGDTGNDTLIGGIGNDVMTGDAGDDILRPGARRRVRMMVALTRLLVTR